MAETRVLQIIHITDLHVGAYGATPTAEHARGLRRGALFLTHYLRDGNRFEWNEGMQTHFMEAPGAFAAYLRGARDSEPEWFEETPTWILDTGDLTTLGDVPSITLGKSYLQEWAHAAGAVEVRALYGNHDAWPSYMPATQLGYSEELLEQQGKLRTFPEWQPQRWATEPLRAQIGGTTAHIELYAVDSIGWPGFRNARAVGSIDPVALTELQEKMEQNCRASGGGQFRILATHHPIVYPYERQEIAAFGPLPWPDKMRLANAKKVATRLRNEPLQQPDDVLAHLLIAGHTHARYPGGRFTAAVTGIHQPWLEPQQLQIVGGSLMLNRSAGEVGFLGAPAPEPASTTREVEGFSHAVLDRYPCQADLLRFTFDTDYIARDGEPRKLTLERIPIIALMGYKYNAQYQKSQKITLYFR